MKSDQFPRKNQRQSSGVKVIFSEKAFLAVIYATVIGFGYLHPKTHSSPPSLPEQLRPLDNK
jgi:hypothetical protein